jgi:hypothetical protein
VAFHLHDFLDRRVTDGVNYIIGGVQGVCDRHEFSREKQRDAFEALVAQIERILTPADNVVPLRGGKTG